MGLKDTLNEAMAEDEFTIDFSGVKSLDFSPIPVGEYDAEVVECKTDKVKSGENAGKPKLVFQFKLVGGEHEGRRFFKHISVATEGGQGILKDLLKAIGEDVSGNLTVRPSTYVGRRCIIKVQFQKGSTEQQEVGYIKAPAAKASGSKLR